MEKHNWTPREAGIAYSLTFAALAAGSIAAATALGIICTFTGIPFFTDGEIVFSSGFAELIYSGVLYSCIALTLIMFTRKTNTDFISATRMNRKISAGTGLKSVLAAVLVFFAFLPLATLFIKLIYMTGFKEFTTFEEMTSGSMSVREYIISIITVAVLPAFVEEFALRGIVAQGLSRYGTAKAVLISAALFSLLHGNPQQTVFQFFGGAVCAYLFLKTDSLWPGIIVHFVNNFIAVTYEFILYNFNLGTNALNVFRYIFFDCDFKYAIFIVPAAALLLWLILKSVKKTDYSKEVPDTDTEAYSIYRIKVSRENYFWQLYLQRAAYCPWLYAYYNYNFFTYNKRMRQYAEAYLPAPVCRAMIYALPAIVLLIISWLSSYFSAFI